MANMSEVKICTTKEGLKAMKDFVNVKLEGSTQKGIYNLLETLEKNFVLQDKNFIVFGWDRIKWYEGLFDDVDAVVDSLDHLTSLNIPYQFIRIGEEFGDVSQRDNISDNYFPWMNIDTVISYEV